VFAPNIFGNYFARFVSKTYDASKVLKETLCSFDAAGIFFLGNLT
jgi:hypothetical protein